MSGKAQTDQEDHVYRSYQTTIYCDASSPILYPSSVEEVQEIVRQALENGQKIKAIGSRHSITDIICTDGIPIQLGNINYTIFNDDGSATFGAGLEMIHVMENLHDKGLSLIHVPTYGGITIGGAIGTGAHGSSLLHPTSISDQTIRLTIVDGKGDIVVIEEPSELRAFKVHLGLLGVIIDVTVSTVPLFKMVVQNTLEPESILTDGTALTWAKSYDWFEMWWFPSTQGVVVSRGNYTDDLSIHGDAYTNLIPNIKLGDIIVTKTALELLQATRNKAGLYSIQDITERSLYNFTELKPPLYTEDGISLLNPATGYGWKLMTDKCNECAWDYGINSVYPEESSMGCDLSQLASMVTAVKQVLGYAEATFSMIGIFIRFSKSSDALMAMSSGRDTVSFEWTTPMRNAPFTTARDGIGGYQGILQSLLNNHGGRPHWGKNGLYFFNPQILNSVHPHRYDFTTFMRKHDPEGIFLNKFGMRLLGESEEVDMDPRVVHCALQDYCICTKNSDCSSLERCVLVNGYSICEDTVEIGSTTSTYPLTIL